MFMEIRCCLCLEGTRIIFEDEPGTDEPDGTYKCFQGTVHVKVWRLNLRKEIVSASKVSMGR